MNKAVKLGFYYVKVKNSARRRHEVYYVWTSVYICKENWSLSLRVEKVDSGTTVSNALMDPR